MKSILRRLRWELALCLLLTLGALAWIGLYLAMGFMERM